MTNILIAVIGYIAFICIVEIIKLNGIITELKNNIEEIRKEYK